jgi:hypothetical protein
LRLASVSWAQSMLRSESTAKAWGRALASTTVPWAPAGAARETSTPLAVGIAKKA